MSQSEFSETQQITTERFGTLRFSPESVIQFPAGLPGFANHHRFILLAPAAIEPLIYLQSLTHPHPRFLMVPAPWVDGTYQLQMESWDAAVVLPDTTENATDFPRNNPALTVYFIVSADPNQRPTVNMLAPVVLRRDLGCGVQAVRADSRYSHASPLMLPARGVQ